MESEKRIAYPVRELHIGTCRIVDAKGEWLSSKQVADALNAAREDAERLDWLSAADLRNFVDRLGGWMVILRDGSKSLGPFRALREAIDAARAAQGDER